jgi:hypothetical protein
MRNRLASGFGILLLIGGLPCIFMIATLSQVFDTHETATTGGNALGLMMMSLWAYGIALVSCVAGIIYFGYAAFRHRIFPKVWHWLAIGYSLGLVVIPFVYLTLY